MRGLLRFLLYALGASAVAIAVAIFVLGAGATAHAFEAAFDAISGPHPGEGAWPAVMDSELRFYAVLWGAYGLLLIAVARHIEARGRWLPWLALVFFLGGIGRLLSLVLVGPPHQVFVLLMGLELVLPPVIVLVWRAGRRGPTS
jgi:hypothetical protein